MRHEHTLGPWEVREVMGQVFVSAEPYEGHPYFGRTKTIEIMSDEDYPTKEADAHLIAAAPMQHDLLVALDNGTWDELTAWGSRYGVDFRTLNRYMDVKAFAIEAAICKAKGE